MNLIAYHGKSETKEKYLNRVRAHREADELVKGGTAGQTRDGFKGCAVTCTLNRYSHEGYETELGIPRMLARLEDGIFESLPDERSMAWPEEFLSAIEPGADLSKVGDLFIHWLLVDTEHGVIRFAKTAKTKEAIERIGAMYARKISGEKISADDWWSARAAADAAAAYAADAADAAAAYAAYADAAAAYAAAAYAAYAAAAYAAAAAAAAADAADDADDADDAAAYAAARSRARIIQADKLLELLKSAPVAELAAV